MQDYLDKRQQIILAILNDEAMTVRARHGAVYCGAGGVELAFTVDEAERMAIDMQAELRERGDDADDLLAWLADIRQAVLSLKNKKA